MFLQKMPLCTIHSNTPALNFSFPSTFIFFFLFEFSVCVMGNIFLPDADAVLNNRPVIFFFLKFCLL